jgi:hypothetical protein
MLRVKALGITALSMVGVGVASTAAAQPSLERVTEAQGLRRLCDAVRTEGSVRFEGDEVQRGRARAEHKRRRDDVLASVYAVEISSGGFSFAEYDFEGKQLGIDGGRGLRPFDAVELVPGTLDDELAFALDPDAAQAAARARAAGKARLKVWLRFRQSPELADPCVRLAGGRSLKIRVDLLALELTGEGGSALARSESPRYKEALAEVSPVATPRVQIGKTELDAAGQHALEAALLPCYKAALAKSPRLRGSLVVALSLDGAGRPESARAEIDATGDAGLVACAIEHVKGHHFARKGGRLSLPITFGGE